MIEQKKIEIDGIEFIINHFPALKASFLEKEIYNILLPVISPLLSGGVGDSILDSEINFDVISKGFSAGLGTMSEERYTDLICRLLKNTSAITDTGVQELTKPVIDKLFIGKSFTIYKLIFEICKHNQFMLFQLVGGGNGMNITGILEKVRQSEKGKLQKSETSEKSKGKD